ncbi:MAG: hypothetical protein U5K69_29745 [Balneolaceae bacterium]|nr:hypothetical protein [Balneolaceae bacterium]
MRKTYRYKDLQVPVGDEEEVEFTVEFISDGNVAQTVVNVPGEHDPAIENAGSASLGKGKNLRNMPTICFSDVANPIPEEDSIRVIYKVNGEVLVEHENAKSEEERPYIVLSIRFNQS